MATTGLLVVVPVRADDPAVVLTWNRDIEPLIRDRCLACHGAGGPALPRLVSYEDVVANAAAVKSAILSRQMPIWAALRGINRYKDDPSLSPFQISRIASWIESRRSRGSGEMAPVVRTSHQPFRPPAARSLEALLAARADGAGLYEQTLVIPERGPLDVVAWRFEPGDRALQQVLFKDAAGRVVWTWIPGASGEVLPAGTGLRLASPVLAVEVHRPVLVASAGAQGAPLQPSRLRLWLASKPTRPLDIVRVPCGRPLLRPGLIYGLRPSSPGISRVLVKDPRRAGVAAAFAPRAYPLLRTYWLREPLAVRPGTGLTVEGTDCWLDAILTPAAR